MGGRFEKRGGKHKLKESNYFQIFENQFDSASQAKEFAQGCDGVFEATELFAWTTP